MIGRIIQNYKIISLIGEGGMGTVYKALDFKLDRYAAIKILNPREIRNPRFVERFKREAKNQAKLSHPNIVSVYGFVEVNTLLGFAMEYIEGKTVEEYLSLYGRLSLNDSVQIMKQVLIGTAYAHSEGFIHRDLKPSNIIIDTKGVVKITDFGIAKSVNESMAITKSGARVGTIYYMSPEQIKGFDSTIKSDLYSLGITFYEMLSGKVPYDFQNEYDVLDAHINNIPIPLSESFPEIPAEVDLIILKAMNKAASNNFNDCTDFIYELENFESNIPLPLNQYQSQPNHIEITIPSKKTSFGKRIFNFLLFLVFIGLLVFSFKAVTDYFIMQEKNLHEQKEEISLGAGPFTTIPSDWKKIDIGTQETINSVILLNNKIILFGNNGLILTSADNGLVWQKQNSGTNSNIYSAVTVANRRIFAAGENGVVLISGDDGNSWSKLKSGTNQSLFSIIFINDILFAAGASGIIIKSTDLGKNWNKINVSDERIIYDISFVNWKDGFLIGWNGLLMQTSDGGKTWSVRDKLTNDYLRSLIFSDINNGIIVGGGGTILKTTDSGKNWKQIDSKITASLNKVRYLNNTAFALGNRGEIYISKDRAETWLTQQTGVFSNLNDIAVTGNGKVFIAGGNGTLISNQFK